jgi:hypothetical protein
MKGKFLTISVIFLSTFFLITCGKNIFNSDETGSIALNIIIDNNTSQNSFEKVSVFKTVEVVVFNSGGTELARQNLTLQGSNWVGDIKVKAGNGHKVQVNAKKEFFFGQSQLLDFSGEAVVNVVAGQTVNANVNVSAKEGFLAIEAEVKIIGVSNFPGLDNVQANLYKDGVKLGQTLSMSSFSSGNTKFGTFIRSQPNDNIIITVEGKEINNPAQVLTGIYIGANVVAGGVRKAKIKLDPLKMVMPQQGQQLNALPIPSFNQDKIQWGPEPIAKVEVREIIGNDTLKFHSASESNVAIWDKTDPNNTDMITGDQFIPPDKLSNIKKGKLYRISIHGVWDPNANPGGGYRRSSYSFFVKN